MQVDLFDPDLIIKINRTMKQIQKRDFAIKKCYKDLNGLDSYFSDKKELDAYKSKMLNLACEKRQYSQIGEAACDNLYELETLAIAIYGSSFNTNLALIVDFSNCLDFVMHRTYNCKIKDIRKIDDYNLISHSLLNCDFTRVGNEVTFERLLSASNEFHHKMSELSAQVRNSGEIPGEEQVLYIMYQFYREILKILNKLKFYVMADVCKQLTAKGNKSVIRSMSYSSVLASTSAEFNDAIKIHQLDGTFDDYVVYFRTYRPYEYVGEVLRRNELTWGI